MRARKHHSLFAPGRGPPAGMIELNGDAPLGLGQRLDYLWRNWRRNRRAGGEFVSRPFSAWDTLTPGASPGRHLTDRFFERILPTLLAPAQIAVLEVGCGSGSLCRRLAALGYAGSYTGLDVADRFERAEVPGFVRTFVQADASVWQTDERFDLVVSVSALEHIADDHAVIAAARSWLKAGGWQVHVVPASGALWLYLWHGWRQYSSSAVAARFSAERMRVWRLGGAVGFGVHFLCITVGEMLLPLRFRRRFPGLYARLLAACRADAALGSRPAHFYAVAERAPDHLNVQPPLLL